MSKFKKIAVVGMGLMGSSLAAALKNTDSDLEILAVDKDEKSIKKAEDLAIIDQGFTEISDNLAEAELIFIAVPVAYIAEVLKKIEKGTAKEQLLVDLGSTKKELMLAAKKLLEDSEKIFIGGHPMAGSHNSGIEWHNPELFKDSPFILCPWISEEERKLEESEVSANSKKLMSLELEMKLLEKKEALKKLDNLLTEIGSQVHLVSAEEHDRCAAYLSHLPHLLSSALVNLSQEDDFKKELFSLSGSGYKDMTRIAGSSADLWQDIILTNKQNLSLLIKKYVAELKELQSNLENNSEKEIYDFLAKAAEIKKDLEK